MRPTSRRACARCWTNPRRAGSNASRASRSMPRAAAMCRHREAGADGAAGTALARVPLPRCKARGPRRTLIPFVRIVTAGSNRHVNANPQRDAVVRFACCVAFALLSAVAHAAFTAPPKPERYATDHAHVVDPARLAALNETLAQFERETSTQIVVYVDRRLPEGTTLEEFANVAFNAWQIG